MTAEQKIHNPFGVAPGQVWEEIKTGRVVCIKTCTTAYCCVWNPQTSRATGKTLTAFTPSRWRRIDGEEVKK